MAARTAGSGALVGIAATMRTEALVYALAIGAVAAVVLLSRRVRLAACAVAGVAFVAALAVPLVANAALEHAVVGDQIRATRAAGTAVSAGDAPSGRAEEALLTTVAVDGSDQGIALGLLIVGLLGAAVWRSRSDPRFAVVAVGGAGAVYAVRFLADGLGFVPGLVAAAPVAALAALAITLRDPGEAPPARAPMPAAPNARRIVVAMALVAVPVVLVFQYRGGAAPQWAGRYLLPTTFLLLTAGAVAGLRGLARPVALAFATLSVAVTAMGVAWLAVRSHDVDRTMRALDRRPEQVLVSAVPHLVREGGAFYGDRHWLTADDEPTRAVAARVAVESGATNLALVEDAAARPVKSLPGFRRTAATRVRLFDGVDLRVTSWALDGPAGSVTEHTFSR